MWNDNDFSSRFQKSQRRFDTMFKLIMVIIGCGFVAIVAFWIFIAVVAVNAADTIGDRGVRGTLEQLWCGKIADCKLPINQ